MKEWQPSDDALNTGEGELHFSFPVNFSCLWRKLLSCGEKEVRPVDPPPWNAKRGFMHMSQMQEAFFFFQSTESIHHE